MIEKFPDIEWQGQHLIWDYRQKAKNNSIVFLRKFLTNDQKEKILKTFPNLKVIQEDNQKRFSKIVSEFFSNPSSKLKVFGVTGSNGKSSTCYYGAQLCSLMGEKSAVIGSLGVLILKEGGVEIEETFDTGFTSPDTPQLHQAFKLLLDKNIKNVFMEVSSHALFLDRVGGVEFNAGVFLNLTRDHLDFHKNMKSYFEAKKLLFSKYLKESVKKNIGISINVSNQEGKEIYNEFHQYYHSQKFELKKDYKIVKRTLSGMTLKTKLFDEEFILPLFGDFNAENLMAALFSLHSLDKLKKFDINLLQSIVPLKGRMQKVPGVDRVCIVDYAHAPDALEKALSSLRGFVPGGSNLWVVFGCGGDRDPGKRPIMGEISVRLSDRVVVTSDNPRSENPDKIIENILSGIPEDFRNKVTVQSDRKKAIEFACKTAAKDDIILIAGKGHENYQILGKNTIHFDDLEVAQEVYSSMN